MGLIIDLIKEQRVADESAVRLTGETTVGSTVESKVESTKAWALGGLLEAANLPASRDELPQRVVDQKALSIVIIDLIRDPLRVHKCFWAETNATRDSAMDRARNKFAFASLCLQQRRRLQKSLFAVNQQRKTCFGQALDNE